MCTTETKYVNSVVADYYPKRQPFNRNEFLIGADENVTCPPFVKPNIYVHAS